MGEIFKSYRDAEKVLRYLLLSGQNTITGMHDLKGFSSINENNSDFDIEIDHLESKHQSRIVQAKKYIEDNYMDPNISLNSVASQVNVSPNHFSTVFSQEEGKTFIEYLTSIRIKYAKQLLSFTKMRCSDITYEVGYRDPHYFSFIFKKNTGISPREFRAQNRK